MCSGRACPPCWCVARAALAAAIGLAVCVSYCGFRACAGGPTGETAPPPAAAAEEDPLGPNGACYVCHMTFVKEELAKTHLAHQVGCVKCHGLSAKHANDENIGETKPDITYPRDKIDASCRECHSEHNVEARKVVARFLERKLSPKTAAVCTDCHGTHKIERSAESKR
jgi:hypothetical protein